jgi:hypothetical protein
MGAPVAERHVKARLKATGWRIIGEQVGFKWDGDIVRVVDIIATKDGVVQSIEVKANTGYYSWLQRTWDRAIRAYRLGPVYGRNNVGTTLIEVDVKSPKDISIRAVKPVGGRAGAFGGLMRGGGGRRVKP